MVLSVNYDKNEKLPEVSVIIPIYNAEQYLSDCLNSVLKQTITNLEILLIDNNSTDNSLKICEEFSKKDARFKVFYCKKQGVSATRNVGLKNARGKFIAFLDADDSYVPDFLANMTSFAKKNNSEITVCLFNYQKRNQKNSLSSYINLTVQQFLETTFSLWSETYKDLLPYGGHIGNKLFSSKILKNEFFIENLKGAEDEIFIFNLRRKISKVTLVSMNLYNYRQGHSSIRKEKNFIFFTTMNRLNLLKQDLNDYEKKIVKSAYVRSVLYLIRQYICSQRMSSSEDIVAIQLISKKAVKFLRGNECLPKSYFGRYFLFDYSLLLILQTLPLSLTVFLFRSINYLILRILMTHQKQI